MVWLVSVFAFVLLICALAGWLNEPQDRTTVATSTEEEETVQ